MSDDTKHPGEHHIPTPAEVRAEHPTVLVPVPPADEVRRIETHDGEHPPVTSSAVAEPTSAPAATPVVESAPADGSADRPVVALEFSNDREVHGDELAQVIAEAAGVVPGVHALGSSTARAVDSARTRLLGRTAVPGVSVLDDAGVLNVEVDLVAEYPANVSELADTVRADVASALEARHDGPVDIDITVTDVHGPFDPIEPDPGEFLDDAAEAIDGAKAKAGAAFDDAKAAVGDAVDTTKAAASDAADAVQAGAADAAGAAVDAIDRAKHDATDVIDDAADTVGETPDSVDDAPAAKIPSVEDAPVATESSAPTTPPAAEVDPVPSDGSADEMAEAAKKLAEAADALAVAAEGVAQDAEDEAQVLEVPVDESLAEESHADEPQTADPQSAGDQPESAHPEFDQR